MAERKDTSRLATLGDISDIHAKIERGFAAVNAEIKGIAGDVKESNVRVELLFKTIFGNGQSGLAERVTRVEETASDISGLSRRVESAETKIDTAESKIDKAQGGLKAVLTAASVAGTAAGIIVSVATLLLKWMAG